MAERCARSRPSVPAANGSAGGLVQPGRSLPGSRRLPALLLESGYRYHRRQPPRSVDESLGDAANTGILTDVTILEDEAVTEAIEALFHPIREVQKERPEWDGEATEITLLVIDDPDTLNAWALPNGQVAIYTGLLFIAEKPEEITGVMAHEVAHVLMRHSLRRTAHSIGVVAGISPMFGDFTSIAGLGAHLLTLSTINGYSQGQETEADLIGAELMIEAKLDPRPLGDILMRMAEKHSHQTTWMSDVLSTHPASKKRKEDIEAHLPDGLSDEKVSLDEAWEHASCARTLSSGR